MSNIVAAVKANKSRIIKRTLIVAGVAATIIVVGVLYKANVDANEALELVDATA